MNSRDDKEGTLLDLAEDYLKDAEIEAHRQMIARRLGNDKQASEASELSRQSFNLFTMIIDWIRERRKRE